MQRSHGTLVAGPSRGQGRSLGKNKDDKQPAGRTLRYKMSYGIERRATGTTSMGVISCLSSEVSLVPNCLRQRQNVTGVVSALIVRDLTVYLLLLFSGATELLHRGRDDDPVPSGAPHVHAGLPTQGGPGVSHGQAAEHLQLPGPPGDSSVPGMYETLRRFLCGRTWHASIFFFCVFVAASLSLFFSFVWCAFLKRVSLFNWCTRLVFIFFVVFFVFLDGLRLRYLLAKKCTVWTVALAFLPPQNIFLVMCFFIFFGGMFFTFFFAYF